MPTTCSPKCGASHKLLSMLMSMLAMAEALSLNAPLCRQALCRTSTPSMLAAKKKAGGKKKKSAPGGATARGFGAAKAVDSAKELTPEQSQWLDFMDWVASSGGKVDAVRLANCGGGLRGIKATRDLKRGEGIVRIPKSLVFNEASAEASPVSGVWRQCDARTELPRYVKIALTVLYEQRRGAASKLRPYLKMLPSPEEFEQDGGPASGLSPSPMVGWTHGPRCLGAIHGPEHTRCRGTLSPQPTLP